MENNDFKQIITFGLENDMKCEFPGARPSYITKISNDSYVSPTFRQIYLFERGKAPQSFPYKFSIIEYIKEYDFLVGVQLNSSHISIVSCSLGYPVILEDFSAHTGGINQIIYSHETHTLVLCGYTTAFIELNVFHPRYQELPTVTLTVKRSIPMCDLNPPGFRVYYDKYRQRLVVPTKAGYSVYSIDGELIKEGGRNMCACHTTTYLFSKNEICIEGATSRPFKRCLTTDSDGRVRVWSGNEMITSEYAIRSNDFIFSEFINSEFAVLVSATNDVILLDIKTGKNMTMMKLPGSPKIIRLFHGSVPRLAVLVSNTIHVLKLKNPWSLFKRLSAAPVIMRRCISQNRAARLCVLTQNSFLSMFSPSIGQFLMSAGATVPSRIVDFIYDRGIVRYNNQVLDTSQQERLFFITEDKKVLAFKETDDSWEFDKQLNMSPRIITVAAAFEPTRLVFCCFAETGDILFYDYEDFSLLTRITLDQKAPLYVHFHYGTGTLLIVYHNEIVGLDLRSFQITFREKTRKPIHAAFDDDICVFSYVDNSISIMEFQLDGLTEITSFVCPEEVKIVNIEAHVFIAVTVMNTILFGQTAEDITTIECPYDIMQVSVLNPNIDLLIGLDKELMVIRREETYPWLQPILRCNEDNDDPRKEKFVNANNKKIRELLNAIPPPPITPVKADTFVNDNTAANIPPLSINTNNSTEVQYEPFKSPKLDRRTLLLEMERITDEVELPSSPIVAKKESCIVDMPKRKKKRPYSATKPKQHIPAKTEEGEEITNNNQEKPEILSILEQYKDVIEQKSASSQSRRRRKSHTKTRSSRRDKDNHVELDGIKEEEQEAEKQENKEEEEQQQHLEEEEQKQQQQNKEEEEEVKETDEAKEIKKKKELSAPLSVPNLTINTKGEIRKQQEFCSISPKKSGKLIDMNRLSSEFRNKSKQNKNIFSQSMNFGDQIALKISVLRTSQKKKPDFSQTMKVSFAKDRMPLQIVKEATLSEKEKAPRDSTRIIENESSSDDEVVEHYSQISTPKGKSGTKFSWEEAFPEEEDGKEEKEKTEEQENKLLTPRKQTRIVTDDDETVDAFLSASPGSSPVKNIKEDDYKEDEELDDEGEEFEELRNTNYVRTSFEIEDPQENMETYKAKPPKDSPRKRFVRPPSLCSELSSQSRGRSKSPLSPHKKLPIPPLPQPMDDTECTPMSPMKRQLESILQEDSRYPSTSRRNPRFSRRSNGERNAINRLEEFEIGYERERRRVGTVCTGRVAIGNQAKPLGDIELAVIIQPLQKKQQNPYSRNRKK